MLTQERKTAIEELIEQESPFLWAQARALTRRFEDAEDLFQDTVMKACKSCDTFQPGTNFRAWIRRIMVNTHINRLRRKDSAHILIDDFSSGQHDHTQYNLPDGQHNAGTDSPEQIFFRDHIDERIMDAVHSLPSEFRAVFNLYHFEGNAYEDISRALGIPVGTVKSRIFRARQVLGADIEALQRGPAAN
jgi:RNA polymerase sigma-70 factor (ECF subfamily)